MMSMFKSIPKLSTKYDYAYTFTNFFIKAFNTLLLMMVNVLIEIKSSFLDLKKTPLSDEVL